VQTWADSLTLDAMILSSRSDPLTLFFHASSSPPMRSLHHPYCLRLPVKARDGVLHSYNSISFSMNDDSPTGNYLLGVTPDNAVQAFQFRAGGAQLADQEDRPLSRTQNLRDVASMDIDMSDPAKEHLKRTSSGRSRRNRQGGLRVEWDEEVRQLASWRKIDDGDDIEEWRAKAKTKSRIMDMRWAWEGVCISQAADLRS
jgi:hypothetical protein